MAGAGGCRDHHRRHFRRHAPRTARDLAALGSALYPEPTESGQLDDIDADAGRPRHSCRSFAILISIFGAVPEPITSKEGHACTDSIEDGNIGRGRVAGASPFLAFSEGPRWQRRCRSRHQRGVRPPSAQLLVEAITRRPRQPPCSPRSVESMGEPNTAPPNSRGGVIDRRSSNHPELPHVVSCKEKQTSTSAWAMHYEDKQNATMSKLHACTCAA